MNQSLDRLRALNETLSNGTVIEPRLFEQIVDSLPDGLLVINEAGLIQLVNQQIEILFGYPRTVLIGQPVNMLLPEDLREHHAEHIERYFCEPTVRPMNLAKTLAGRHRNGRTINVQIILGPLVSTQGVLALAVVRRVVTHGT